MNFWRSVIFIFQSYDKIYFSKKFLYFFVYIFDVLSVSFILSFIISLFISLLILVTKLAINFSLLSTFFLTQHFFNGGNCSRNRLSIFQNAVEFWIRWELLIRLTRALHIYISFHFFFRNSFKLSSEFFYFILDFLEVSNIVIFLLFWFFR